MAAREMGRQSSRAPDHSMIESRNSVMLNSIVASSVGRNEVTAVRDDGGASGGRSIYFLRESWAAFVASSFT
jgi:hypothetical protein